MPLPESQYVQLALGQGQPSAPGSDEDAAKKELERLRSTHRLWDKYASEWKFFVESYEGGSAFLKPDYIFKHSRENDDDFKDRVKRIHNTNYIGIIVDFFVNFIFSETIDRNGGADEDFFLNFIKDVNRKGEPIDAFMRQVCEDMQIFGMSYAIVDTPPKNQDMSKYDEVRNNIRPYWVLVKPDEILDWEVDEFDKFQYVKRKQCLDGRGGKQLERYTEFYPDKVQVSVVDVTNSKKEFIVEQFTIEHNEGVVPVVVTRYKRSKLDPFMGVSFLTDLSYNQREIMNLTSMNQDFLYRQAFNILAKEVETHIPTVEQSEGDIGTANVLEIPKGAAMPQYISPPVAPADAIAQERARIKNEMFIRAAQDFVGELFNGEKASGFSQATSFSKTVPFISSRADALETFEHELMKFTLQKIGKEWKGKIKYKDRYEITNITDALTHLQILIKDLQIGEFSETFVKEQLKRLVSEFDGKLPKEVLAKVMHDIDSADFSGWKHTQKEALVGKESKTSPAAQQKSKQTGTMEEAAAEAKVNTGATKKLR